MPLDLIAGWNITNPDPIDTRHIVTQSSDRYGFSFARIHNGLTTFESESQEYYILANSASYTNAAGWSRIYTSDPGGQGLSVSGSITASVAISASGDISASNFKVANDIELSNDSKIFVGSSTTEILADNDDFWVIKANGRTVADFKNSGVIVNPANNAGVDFRVAGGTKTHLLFTDAGADKVAIGTDTVSDSLLTVEGDISAAAISASSYISGGNNFHLLRAGGGGTSGIKLDAGVFGSVAALITPTGDASTIKFGDSTSGYNFDLQNHKLAFDSDTTNTFIQGDTQNPENLNIHADQDIYLRPDHAVVVFAGPSSPVRAATFGIASSSFHHPLELIDGMTAHGLLQASESLSVEGAITASSLIYVKDETTDAGGLLLYGGTGLTTTPYISPQGAAAYTLRFGKTTSGYNFDFGNNKISFDNDATNTYIQANTENPEDLEIHADQDIVLHADGEVIVSQSLIAKDSIEGRFNGSFDIVNFKSLADTTIFGDATRTTLFSGTEVRVTPSLTASNDISASGDIYAQNFYVEQIVANSLVAEDTDDPSAATIALKDADGNSVVQLARVGDDDNAHRGRLILRDNEDIKVQLTTGNSNEGLYSFINGTAPKFGIGTDTPTEQLEVIGDAKISSDTTSTNFYAQDGDLIFSSQSSNVDQGIRYEDIDGQHRYAILFPSQTNKVVVTNRAPSTGVTGSSVEIRGTLNGDGPSWEEPIAKFERRNILTDTGEPADWMPSGYALSQSLVNYYGFQLDTPAGQDTGWGRPIIEHHWNWKGRAYNQGGSYVTYTEPFSVLTAKIIPTGKYGNVTRDKIGTGTAPGTTTSPQFPTGYVLAAPGNFGTSNDNDAGAPSFFGQSDGHKKVNFSVVSEHTGLIIQKTYSDQNYDNLLTLRKTGRNFAASVMTSSVYADPDSVDGFSNYYTIRAQSNSGYANYVDITGEGLEYKNSYDYADTYSEQWRVPMIITGSNAFSYKNTGPILTNSTNPLLRVEGRVGYDEGGYDSYISTLQELVFHDSSNINMPNQTSYGSMNFLQFKKINSAGTPTILGTIRISGTGGNSIELPQISDKRRKTNIKDTKCGINDLLKIKVRDFNWKSDPTGPQTAGFIAQEVHEVVPDLRLASVGGDDPNMDPWTIVPSSFTPLLVKAIQDQQKMIEELKQEINELKSKI